MGQFMIRRTLYAVVTLFILSLTIFTVVRLTGDPVTLLAEPGARAEDLAASEKDGREHRLVVDAVVEPHELRAELIARYLAAAGKDRHFSRRRHGVTPV